MNESKHSLAIIYTQTHIETAIFVEISTQRMSDASPIKNRIQFFIRFMYETLNKLLHATCFQCVL